MKFNKLLHLTRDVTGQHYRPLPSDVSLPRLSERRRRLKFRLHCDVYTDMIYPLYTDMILSLYTDIIYVTTHRHSLSGHFEHSDDKLTLETPSNFTNALWWLIYQFKSISRDVSFVGITAQQFPIHKLPLICPSSHHFLQVHYGCLNNIH